MIDGDGCCKSGDGCGGGECCCENIRLRWCVGGDTGVTVLRVVRMNGEDSEGDTDDNDFNG